MEAVYYSLIASALCKVGELAYGKLPALKTKLFQLMGNDDAQNIMAALENDRGNKEIRARLKSCLDRTPSQDKTDLEKCAKEILDAIQAEISGKPDVDQELATIIHNHQNHIYTMTVSGDHSTVVQNQTVINHGISLLDYEAGLKRREQEVRRELETASEEQWEIHNIELQALHQKMSNIEESHGQRLSEIEALKTALEKLSNNISDNELKSALAALDQGNTTEAKALLESIVEKENEGVKPFAEAQFQLGKIAQQEIDYETAFTHFERALQLTPDDTLYLNEAGILAEILGQYDKAIEYYQKALTSDLNTYGKDHPVVAIGWNNLGSAWHSLGQYDKAIKYYQKALISDLNTYGKNHPYVAIRQNNLGSAWHSLGQYDKAIKYYEKALTSDLNTYGKDHPRVATGWNNLGLTWHSLGQHDKAIEYYQKALTSDLNTYDEDHPKVAIRWNNLGSAWDSLGQYGKAIKYYKKALTSLHKTFPSGHPHIDIAEKSLTAAREALGKSE